MELFAVEEITLVLLNCLINACVLVRLAFDSPLFRSNLTMLMLFSQLLENTQVIFRQSHPASLNAERFP